MPKNSSEPGYQLYLEPTYSSNKYYYQGSLMGVAPFTWQTHGRKGEWFSYMSDGNLTWYNPTKYFLGEYKLTLTEKTTYLYDDLKKETETGEFSSGKLAPQTVTVVEKYMGGGKWRFKIKTSFGEKLITPKEGSYYEFQ